jgi:hypothetical protein
LPRVEGGGGGSGARIEAGGEGGGASVGAASRVERGSVTGSVGRVGEGSALRERGVLSKDGTRGEAIAGTDAPRSGGGRSVEVAARTEGGSSSGTRAVIGSTERPRCEGGPSSR